MNIKQDFKVYCSTNLTKSLIEDSFQGDDDLYIEGIASTTSIDEDGDYMTKSCLEDMKRQVIGLNILKEHGRTLDDIIGRATQVLDSNDDTFKIKSKILPRFKYYLIDLLENDINLGYSIGAKAIDYEPNEQSEYGWKINKVKLYEISLVPLPANWDSFGSVKISKELDNDSDTIVAKCFNGACKQLVKNYSENATEEPVEVSKEIEDAQKNDEDVFLTKKECINLINEASLEIYERLLSEILDETKKMIEKYHLDTKQNNNNNESSETDKSNDKKESDNSSKKKEEDEEKEKSMSEEINEKIEVETPDVQKNLEESVDGTSEGTEMKIEEKVEKEIDKEVTVNVSTETVSNEDVLKSINEMKDFFMKKFDEELEKKVDEKVEEIRKNLREEVEEDLLKDLTTERKPVETEQPKVEKEIKEEVVVEKENKAMNAHDIAKMLTQ